MQLPPSLEGPGWPASIWTAPLPGSAASPPAGPPAQAAIPPSAVDGVDLSPAAQQALAQGSQYAYAPVGQAPQASAVDPGGEEARIAAVEKALASGQPVTFKNVDAEHFQVSVRPASPKEPGVSSYTVAFGGHQLRVNLEPGIDPIESIARVTNFLSQYPPNLRKDLKAVNLFNGAHPTLPEARAWVDERLPTGQGEINFQFGTRNLQKLVFDHEMGHVLGDFVEDRQASAAERAEEAAAGVEADFGFSRLIPEGWGEAIALDNRSVSPYGDTNQAEDFAEFWQEFMKAEARGLHSRPMEKLAQRFPHRLWIALHIYHGLEYRPAEASQGSAGGGRATVS